MKQRKINTLLIPLFLAILLVVSGCGKKVPTEGEKAGVLDLLSLIPDNASGIFMINFKKLAKQAFFDTMIQESEKKNTDLPRKVFKNYQDFVDKTGIDPKKDINSMAFGLYGKLEQRRDADVVAVINLNYHNTSILKLMKENDVSLSEDSYRNIGIYKVKDEDGKDMAFSFVSENIIAGGCPLYVKKVIDLFQREGRSIKDNSDLAPYLQKIKGDEIGSFLLDLPDEVKKIHDAGMFQVDLSKAEVFIGRFDYANRVFNGDISLISYNEEGNQQLVSTLNGLKMMAGAVGAEFAELMNNINLTATAERVKLSISISEELLKKLKTKIEEKTKQHMTPSYDSQSDE